MEIYWVYSALILSLVTSAYGLYALWKLKLKTQVIQFQADQIRIKNDELLDKNNQLVRLNQEKNQLISVVSHDLKSPLNRVFALINLIKMDTDQPLTKSQLDYLDRIQRTVNEGMLLIRNLLDIRAIEDKGIEKRMIDLNLKSAVSSIVKLFQTEAEKKDINLSLKVNLEDDEFFTDKQYINRIVENLLSNAVKYTPLGGKVEVLLEEKNEEIIISFLDEGPGVKEENESKLFKKFQVLEAEATGGESSTGLGLSIVQALCRGLEGEVYYEKRESKGSCFYCVLPRLQVNAEKKAFKDYPYSSKK